MECSLFCTAVRDSNRKRCLSRKSPRHSPTVTVGGTRARQLSPSKSNRSEKRDSRYGFCAFFGRKALCNSQRHFSRCHSLPLTDAVNYTPPTRDTRLDRNVAVETFRTCGRIALGKSQSR